MPKAPAPAAARTLLSGPGEAGGEVRLSAFSGQVRSMDKERVPPPRPVGVSGRCCCCWWCCASSICAPAPPACYPGRLPTPAAAGGLSRGGGASVCRGGGGGGRGGGRLAPTTAAAGSTPTQPWPPSRPGASNRGGGAPPPTVNRSIAASAGGRWAPRAADEASGSAAFTMPALPRASTGPRAPVTRRTEAAHSLERGRHAHGGCHPDRRVRGRGQGRGGAHW